MVCYKAGRETGAWYELKSIRAVIANKEARGESATFERGIYKAWLKHPEYAKADKENRSRGLYGTLSPLEDKREPVAKIMDKGKVPVANYATAQEGILRAGEAIITPFKGISRGRGRERPGKFTEQRNGADRKNYRGRYCEG